MTCWSWMNCGRLLATRRTKYGFGSLCVAALGRWWPGGMENGTVIVAGVCGTESPKITGKRGSTPTSMRLTPVWCQTNSIVLVLNQRDKPITLSDSTSHCVSESLGLSAKRCLFPRNFGTTSMPCDSSLSNTTVKPRSNISNQLAPQLRPLPLLETGARFELSVAPNEAAMPALHC